MLAAVVFVMLGEYGSVFWYPTKWQKLPAVVKTEVSVELIGLAYSETNCSRSLTEL